MFLIEISNDVRQDTLFNASDIGEPDDSGIAGLQSFRKSSGSALRNVSADSRISGCGRYHQRTSGGSGLCGRSVGKGYGILSDPVCGGRRILLFPSYGHRRGLREKIQM